MYLQLSDILAVILPYEIKAQKVSMYMHSLQVILNVIPNKTSISVVNMSTASEL